MSRRSAIQEVERDTSKDWLLTYADMITLLTVFFILLYSMSVINDDKLQELALSVRSGFGGQLKGKGNSISSGGAGRSDEIKIQPFQSIVDDLHKRIEEQFEGSQSGALVDVSPNDRGELVVSLYGAEPEAGESDAVFFERGSASLSPAAIQAIRTIAQLIPADELEIRVEGHTCDLPINTPEFPSNMELAYERASNVVRILRQELSSPGTVTTPVSFGDKVPKKPNTSEANRRFNRRVDIILRPVTKARSRSGR